MGRNRGPLSTTGGRAAEDFAPREQVVCPKVRPLLCVLCSRSPHSPRAVPPPGSSEFGHVWTTLSFSSYRLSKGFRCNDRVTLGRCPWAHLHPCLGRRPPLRRLLSGQSHLRRQGLGLDAEAPAGARPAGHPHRRGQGSGRPQGPAGTSRAAPSTHSPGGSSLCARPLSMEAHFQHLLWSVSRFWPSSASVTLSLPSLVPVTRLPSPVEPGSRGRRASPHPQLLPPRAP